MDTCAIAGAWRSTYFWTGANSMSNSMSNDYFSFMSSKWEDKHTKQHPPTKAPPATSVLSSDTIDFVEEPQIEVTDSFVSDMIIQRIFNRFSAG
jgi:hypothetical protein